MYFEENDMPTVKLLQRFPTVIATVGMASAARGGATVQANTPDATRHRELLPVIALLVALVFAGSPASWAQGAGPTDPQIAAIVVTANQVDIDAATLAKATSKRKDVQDFAQLMITDHSGVNKAATELVQKLHVTPDPNPTSESLQKGGDDNLARLKKLHGHAFDKAYIDHEVAYHEAVLQAIDKTLVPSAHNAELKALLIKARPAFVAHFDHAKQLQTELSQGGA
jgi:putative membrane protein